jgi:hypothetical protein
MKLTEKQRKIETINRKYRRYETTDAGKETAKWTYIEDCLHGLADDYEKLEENYCSYGPDGFRAVGPTFGPIHITGEKAKEAYARVGN